MYVVVLALFKAGDHVPEIPLLEIVGNGAKVSPEQIGAMALKTGVAGGLTITVKVWVDAH